MKDCVLRRDSGRTSTLPISFSVILRVWTSWLDRRFHFQGLATRAAQRVSLGTEFLPRFLLHVLPQGFTKIRHYGLLANNRRQRRVQSAKAALEKSRLRFEPATASAAPAPPPSSMLCPHCQSNRLRCVARIDASGKWTLFAGAALCPDLPRYLDSS